MIFPSMQVPSTSGSQILLNGWHLTHINSMATPRMALTVMMMNQMNHLIQPVQSLSMVRPKDVLLQAAERTEKKPA
jgi:hypothetical protein